MLSSLCNRLYNKEPKSLHGDTNPDTLLYFILLLYLLYFIIFIQCTLC